MWYHALTASLCANRCGVLSSPEGTCGACMSAAYCSPSCQTHHWPEHEPRCRAHVALALADVLAATGHDSVFAAAAAGDIETVRAAMGMQANVEAVEASNGWTVVYGPTCGHLDVLVYLVEECGASLSHVSNDGILPLHAAAAYGSLEIVRYVAKKTPKHIEAGARGGSPFSWTSANGMTALDWALANGHQDVARLLEDIESAGGWRGYVATLRMQYVLLRHEVSRTHAVLDEGHDDRELLHLVFGRNRATVDAAAPSHGERLEEASEDGTEKAKAMLELPDVVFALVCRMLE